MTDPIACHLCGKPSLGYIRGAGGAQLPICAHDYISLQGVENERQRQASEAVRNSMAMMNHATAEMDAITGIRVSPRIAIPPPTPATSYTNVSVTGSNVGVINTATVGQITANLGMMANADPAKRALSDLTAAILEASELSNEARQSLLDQLSVVSSQAAIPEDERKPAVIAPLLAAIGQGAGAVTAVAGAWKAVEPILRAHFGL